MWQIAYIVGKSNIKILNKMLIYLNFSGHLSTYLYNKKKPRHLYIYIYNNLFFKFIFITISLIKKFKNLKKKKKH